MSFVEEKNFVLEIPVSIHMQRWILLPDGVKRVYINGGLLSAHFAFVLFRFLSKSVVERLDLEIIQVVLRDIEEILEVLR